jgi:hypothetical protein
MIIGDLEEDRLAARECVEVDVEGGNEVDCICGEGATCAVEACNSNSYSIWEGFVDGVEGRRTAIDREEMGISINTGFRDNAPRRALHPAPWVTKMTTVSPLPSPVVSVAFPLVIDSFS